jgi:hypothetical protein
MATKKDSVSAFEALSDSEKERIWREIDQLTPEQIAGKSRRLNSEERALWNKFKRKVGRPRIGQGVKVVSVGVEKNLLKKTDALAKRRGVNRSALVNEALKALIVSAA